MSKRERMTSRVERMTSAPVRGLVLRMAGPTMCAMMVSAVYSLADTYFVSGVGTTATAAVGVSYPLMAVIQAIGFLFGHGAGNYLSRQLGAKNYERAERMAATGFFSSLLAGGALTAFGLTFLDALARTLGSTPTILPLAEEYLFYILLAAPWMAASFTLSNLLRFQGNALYGLLGMATGAVLNIILDPIFIFALGMGVKGAAVATMISQFVGFAMLYAANLRQDCVRIRLGNFLPGLAAYWEIARGGFPSLCRQGLASVAAICLNQLAGTHGDAAIAALSIVQRVSMFAGALLVGFGHGFQPVCGFNYGARRYDRVKGAFWFCVRSATLVLLVVAALGFIYAPGVIALFRPDDPEVVGIGAFALRCQCLTFPFMGWVMLNNMMMQNIGLAGRAVFMAMSRHGLFLIPYLLLIAPDLGLLGVQIAQPLADIGTLLLSVPMGIGLLSSFSDRDESGTALPDPRATPPTGQSGRFDLDQVW